MKKFVIKLLQLLHIISDLDIFKPVSKPLDNYDHNYIYAYVNSDTGTLLPNTHLFLFKNVTLAIYTLYLFCITHMHTKIKLICLGSIYNNEYILNSRVDLCDYFSGLKYYNDYKLNYGDVSDIPFKQVEDVVIQFLIKMCNNNDIDDIVSKYNITTMSNDELKSYLNSILNLQELKDGQNESNN